MTMITIRTASWFTPLPPDHARIGISRGVPRFGAAGKGYRLFKALNPGPWFRSCATAEEYVERYAAEILGPLDPVKVAEQLLELAGGRVPTLCCFERVGGPQWCHRSLAARWLSDGLGVPVPELGYEGLTQDQHPLRPPPTRQTRLL
jgi:hypothetical protein